MSKYTEILAVKKGLLCKGDKISRQIGPTRLIEILTIVKANCVLLGEIADSVKGDADMGTFVSSCQEEIVRSFLGADLLNMYDGHYFKIGTGHEKMMDNVKLIIGVPSAKETERETRTNFQKMARNIIQGGL